MSCGCRALVVGRLATAGAVSVLGDVAEFGVAVVGGSLGESACDAGGVLNGGATAKQQGGEEKGPAPPRHRSRIYRGLTRKWARRFLAQHDSVCSVHCGRSSP